MKRKKLLKALGQILDPDQSVERRHRDELEGLLTQLKKKENALEVKLAAEPDKQKRKRLAKELEITRAQHAKGMQALEDMSA